MPKCEPVGLDFVDRAAIVERLEVVVEASPSEVWRVLNETERWPEWFDGMKAARVTSDKWDGVGSSRFVNLGALQVHEQVVVWEPDQHWGFTATEVAWMAPIAKRLLETVKITPEGDGSRLSYTGAVDPPWFAKPLSKLLRKQMSSAWSTNLANIDKQVARS